MGQLGFAEWMKPMKELCSMKMLCMGCDIEKKKQMLRFSAAMVKSYASRVAAHVRNAITWAELCKQRIVCYSGHAGEGG